MFEKDDLFNEDEFDVDTFDNDLQFLVDLEIVDYSVNESGNFVFWLTDLGMDVFNIIEGCPDEI